MSIDLNLIGQSVSGTPGTGTITLGAALSGLRALAATVDGITVNGQLLDVLLTDGANQSVEIDCLYNSTAGTLARGTVESSTTGARLSLTSGATVRVVAAASRAAAWQNNLGQVVVTGTPTAGQVPIASSGTAAAWGTPSGGLPAGVTSPGDGALNLAAGTITASRPGINVTQTWNNSGAAFDADVVNVTNTASAATSTLLDRRVGGNRAAAITRDSSLVLQQQTGAGSYLVGVGPQAYQGLAFYVNGFSDFTRYMLISPSGRVHVRAGTVYGFSSDATFPETAVDTALGRNAAGVAEVNNGTLGTFRDLRLRNLIASQVVQTQALTVATLPAAASWAGGEAYVTDANSPTIGSTVASGGSAKAIVRSNGTNWIVTSVI